jgi:hypothetical protein
MHREDLRRGFSIYVPLYIFLFSLSLPSSVSTSHQNVVLEIDFAGALWVTLSSCRRLISSLSLPQGYTDILVVPNDKALRTIHLHSRQCSTSNMDNAAVIST